MQHAREDVQRVLWLADLLQDGRQVAACCCRCRAIQATGQATTARRSCASTCGGAPWEWDTSDIDKALAHGSAREAESAGTVPADHKVTGGKAFDQVGFEALAGQPSNIIPYIPMH